MSEVKRTRCRTIPQLSYVTADDWGRDGTRFFSGVLLSEPFGSIPAGEYRSGQIDVEFMELSVITEDGDCLSCEFTITPKGE